MADILSNMLPILVDAVEGAQLLRISERRFHELRREPGFPAAVVLGARSVRWLREELVDYARSLPRVGVLGEPAQLQTRRASRSVSARGRDGTPLPGAEGAQ